VCVLLLVYSTHKTCEGIVVGKQPKKVFKSIAPQRTKQPLGVIHSDVCDPIGKRW